MNNSIYFENYSNYTLDNSNLPKHNLSLGNEGDKLSLNLKNPRCGFVSIETPIGSFNLTREHNSVDLECLNKIWTQKGKRSPWFVNKEQSTLASSSYVGIPTQGSSVSLSADGNVLAVGAPGDNYKVGATFIFLRKFDSNTNNFYWEECQKLIGTGYVGTSSQGSSVSLSADGNTLAVGGRGDNGGIGAVWIFSRAPSNNPPSSSNNPPSSSNNPPSSDMWLQQGSKLVGSGYISTPNQGRSVSLSADGNILAVGGNGDDSGIGAVWIFKRTISPSFSPSISPSNSPSESWLQQGPKLVGSGYVGRSFQGKSVNLSADGYILAIGGDGDNTAIGATWIFKRTNETWNYISKVVGTGNIGPCSQGASISLSADGYTLAVGGNLDASGIGATWIFTFSKSHDSYSQIKLVGSTEFSFQGVSVSLSADGTTLAVGGNKLVSNDVTVGGNWIYTKYGEDWVLQTPILINKNMLSQGSNVCLSADGNTLASGGPSTNENVGAVCIFV